MGYDKATELIVVEGSIKPSNDAKSTTVDYNPFEEINLPNAFSKVNNERSALRFIKKYGFLGYSELKKRRDIESGKQKTWIETDNCDPISWIFEHAQAVRFILDLIEGLNREDGDFIHKILTTRRIVSDEANAKIAAFGKRLLPHRERDRIQTIKLLKRQGAWSSETPTIREEWILPIMAMGWSESSVFPFRIVGFPIDYLKVARDIITFQVNLNTIYVGFSLGDWGRLKRTYHGVTLIEAIWFHIGNMAIIADDASRKDKGKIIRRCEECSAPFISTDKRQRFCPPKYHEIASVCAARNRMRRHYARNKGSK